MASSSSSSLTPIQWSVCEIDMKGKCLESILNNHCLKYYWALFYHDGSVECEIVDEFSEKLQYYHMFVWYIKEPKVSKKKSYFSNLPLMQYIRRIYLSQGEIAYPTVFETEDVISRLVSLLNSKHRFIKESSHIPHWIEEELTQYL